MTRRKADFITDRTRGSMWIDGDEYVQNYHQRGLGAENMRTSYLNVLFANKCLKEHPFAAEIISSSMVGFRSR